MSAAQPASDLTLELDEGSARLVVLAQAVDEIDAKGELLPLEQRLQITREEASGRSGPDSWLVPRATRIAAALVKSRPAFRASLKPWSLSGLAVGSWCLALCLGLGANALGPERGISILAPPLLGLILWNWALFLVLLCRNVYQVLAPPGAEITTRRRISRWLEAWRRRFLPDDDSLGSQIERRCAHRWLTVSAPLLSARVTWVLHVAAALMVLGTVAGMYVRGLAFEYRATWESTFLTAGFVDRLLGVFLWPATSLGGFTLPAAAELKAPAAGPAAPWIHAWAICAGLFVVIPRLLLASASWWRALRLRRRLPVEISSTYLQRLHAAASTRQHSVLVIPYSFRPAEKAASLLRGALHDLVGARAHIRFSATANYGQAAPLSDAVAQASWLVVVFNMAQTPEIEVHGEALKETASALADGQRLIVVVDEGQLAKRTSAEQLTERLQSRRRAWRRVVDGAGLPAAFLRLDDHLDADSAIETLGTAAWAAAAHQES